MPDESPSLTLTQKLAVAGIVLAVGSLVLGTLFVSIVYLPAPWHIGGVALAVAIYWFFQRDTLIETAVIFMILLLFCSMAHGAVQKMRKPKSQANLWPGSHSEQVRRGVCPCLRVA